MTGCLFGTYQSLHFINIYSFPLEYMTIMGLCQYLETIQHKETRGEQQQSSSRAAASLVFYERLYFVDQVSSHHQDLRDVVSLCHFIKELDDVCEVHVIF